MAHGLLWSSVAANTTTVPGLLTQLPDTYTIQRSSIIINKHPQKYDENPGKLIKVDLALLIFNWVIGSSSTTDWFTRIQNSWPKDCSGAPLLIQPPYRDYWPKYPTHTIQRSSVIINRHLQKDDENPGRSVKEDLALLMFNWLIGSSSTTDWFTRIQNSWPMDCSGDPLLIQPHHRTTWATDPNTRHIHNSA